MARTREKERMCLHEYFINIISLFWPIVDHETELFAVHFLALHFLGFLLLSVARCQLEAFVTATTTIIIRRCRRHR